MREHMPLLNSTFLGNYAGFIRSCLELNAG
jgi:hypothetical protein